MHIFVCGVGSLSLDVGASDTIASVKAVLRSRVPDGEAVDLFFAGKPLVNDSFTLLDYNIHSGSNLQLSLGGLLGGLTVFNCPVTKKQMISDAFPSELCKDPDGADIPGLRCFQSRKMAAGGEDIDVGGGGAFGGAGADEVVDDSIETVDAIEYTFQLETVELKQKDLKDYLSKWFPAVRARWREEGRPKEEIKAMMQSAAAAVMFLLKKVKECEVFVNSDFDMDGAICLREWTEKGNVYYYVMHGLEGGRDKCAF